MTQEQKRNIYRLMAGCAAVWLLYCTFTRNYANYTPRNPFDRCPPAETSETITEKELYSFLKIKHRYQYLNDKYNDYTDISILADKPSVALPWHLKFWLFKNCWDANRFYYVEQRARQIIRTSYLLEHSRGVISILQRLIKEESDSNKIIAYKEMIKSMEQTLDIEKISEEELKMVQGKEILILNALDGTFIVE